LLDSILAVLAILFVKFGYKCFADVTKKIAVVTPYSKICQLLTSYFSCTAPEMTDVNLSARAVLYAYLGTDMAMCPWVVYDFVKTEKGVVALHPFLTVTTCTSAAGLTAPAAAMVSPRSPGS
jgi:hypothetical protein